METTSLVIILQMQIMGAYKGGWGGGMDRAVENTPDAVEKQLQCIWQGSSKILWLQFGGSVGRIYGVLGL